MSEWKTTALDELIGRIKMEAASEAAKLSDEAVAGITKFCRDKMILRRCVEDKTVEEWIQKMRCVIEDAVAERITDSRIEELERIAERELQKAKPA